MARTEWRGGERYFWVLFILGILVVIGFELGVMVIEHFFFPVEIYGFVTLFWSKDNGFYVETSEAH
jgi:hypothetical protein